MEDRECVIYFPDEFRPLYKLDVVPSNMEKSKLTPLDLREIYRGNESSDEFKKKMKDFRDLVYDKFLINMPEYQYRMIGLYMEDFTFKLI